MIFEAIAPAPPDSILGLTEAFEKDSNPHKINLGVGVYVDDGGRTPVLRCVKAAEQALLEGEHTKSYLPISGAPEYGRGVQELIFGACHPLIQAGRARTVQTPGGTGALRVGAEFLKKFLPTSKVWFSAPTWPNHKGIFMAAGFQAAEYPYYDPAAREVDFNAMCEGLRAIPEKDIVLLHVCCHNPTGADLSPDQWKVVAEIAAAQKWVPFFDFAYQGLGDGLVEDRAGLMPFLEILPNILVASSFSKNFGLYNERTGALTLVAGNTSSAESVFSQVKTVIRVIYSNPPAHGGAIVTHILKNQDLRAMWEVEVAMMRQRIASVRSSLAENLCAQRSYVDFSFITRQKGMFSFSGLSDAQVTFLRDKKSIYMVPGGRINVAGILSSNIDYLCQSILESLKITT